MWHGKRWFFGCCSLPTESHVDGHRMLSYLTSRGRIHDKLFVMPRSSSQCSEPNRSWTGGQCKPEVPPLLSLYLRYGAKVCGPPAHDRRFHTVDFFTVVDLQEMDERTFQNFVIN